MKENINLKNFISQAWEQPEEQTIANYVIKNKHAIENNPFGAKDFFQKLKDGNQGLLLNCSHKFIQMLDDLISSLNEAKEVNTYRIVRTLDENNMPCIKREKIKIMEYRYEWDTVDIVIHTKDGSEMDAKMVNRIMNCIRKEYKVESQVKGRTSGLGTYSEITIIDCPLGILAKLQKSLKKINPLLTNDIKNKQINTPVMENKKIEKIEENDTSDMAVYDKPVGDVMKKRLELFDPYKNAINVAKDSKTVVKFKMDEIKESVNKLGDLNKIFVIEHTFISRNPTAELLVTSDLGKSLHEVDKKKFANFIRRNVDIKEYITEKGFNFNGFIKGVQDGEFQLLIKEYFSSLVDDNNDLKINDFNIDFDKVTIGYFYPQDDNETRVDFPIEDFRSFCEEIDPDFNDYYVNDGGTTGNRYSEGLGMTHDFNNYLDNKTLPEQYELANRFLKYKGIIKEPKQLQKEGFRDYNIWKSEVATLTKNNFKILEHKGNLIAKSDKLIIGGWNSNSNGGFIYK